MRYLQKYSCLAIIVLLFIALSQMGFAAEIVDDSAVLGASLKATVQASKIDSSKPLAEELALLLGGKNKWSMEPNVAGLKVGPMDLPSASLESVLRLMVNAAGADYRISGDSIVVFKLPNGEWNKATTLDARGITLEKAMNMLFTGSGIKGSIDPSVSQVKLSSNYTNLPLGTLMNAVLKEAGANYQVQNDTICVTGTPALAVLADAKADAAPAKQKLANGEFVKLMDTPLYLEFVQMPLTSALEAMLRGTGLDYSVSPELASIKVNATLKNVTLKRALREVINAVGADYRISNTTVRVTPPQPLPAGMLEQMRQYAPSAPSASAAAPANSWASNASNQKLTSKSITLNNVAAADVAPTIAQQGIQVASTSDKKLVITGPEDQVKQAENIIGTLESSQSQRKPIKVTINVKTRASKSAAPKILQSLTICSIDGEPAVLETTTTVPGSSDYVHVLDNVTPSLEPDGRIAVQGFVKLKWKFRDSKRGEINYVSPETPFDSLLIPGREIGVAEMRIGGGIDTILDITAIAVIDKTAATAKPK